MSGPRASGERPQEERLHVAYHLPSYARLSALLVALTVIAVVVWPVASPSGRALLTAGPVSNQHRLIESQCESCHGAPFEAGTDARCAACHDVGDHAASMPALRAAHPERVNHCASCHKEHHGRTSLIPVESPLCTECHRDVERLVPGTKEVAVESFAQHPEFSALLRRLPTGPPNDATRLKFSHAKHLEQRGGKAGAPVTCASCHTSALGRRTMRPIAFEKHCASCHALDLDGRLAGKRVPHGDPERVAHTIMNELARAYVRGESASPELEGRLETEGHDLERALYTEGNGCMKCHDVTAVPASAGERRFAVVPPNIPPRRLGAAKFSHHPHRATACRDCHGTAESSTSASDLSLPGIALCRDCHADPGTSGKIESPCVACHRYHGDP